MFICVVYVCTLYMCVRNKTISMHVQNCCYFLAKKKWGIATANSCICIRTHNISVRTAHVLRSLVIRKSKANGEIHISVRRRNQKRVRKKECTIEK